MSTEEPSGEHNLASTSGPSRPLFTLRALVSTQQSGLIIGKEGQNVKQLRSEVNCRVKVSEHVEDSYERILSVSADTCEDVVKAYSVILNKLKQEGRSREVTLLIPHQQMGSSNY
jgi:transcription antitermination factor NusA-like protein